MIGAIVGAMVGVSAFGTALGAKASRVAPFLAGGAPLVGQLGTVVLLVSLPLAIGAKGWAIGAVVDAMAGLGAVIADGWWA